MNYVKVLVCNNSSIHKNRNNQWINKDTMKKQRDWEKGERERGREREREVEIARQTDIDQAEHREAIISDKLLIVGA